MATHVLSLRSVSRPVGPDPAAARSNALADAFWACACQVRRFLCGLVGHNQVLSFDNSRLSLRCTECGKQTRGWRIGC